jgi:hypothetical protein
MKILFGTAVALAGMMFGNFNAIAASPGISSTCNIIQRGGTVASFTGNSVDYVEIIRTPSGTGTQKNVNASCQVRLPTGTSAYFNFQTTGVSCVVDGVATTDWLEAIYTSGITYMSCHIMQ